MAGISSMYVEEYFLKVNKKVKTSRNFYWFFSLNPFQGYIVTLTEVKEVIKEMKETEGLNPFQGYIVTLTMVEL